MGLGVFAAIALIAVWVAYALLTWPIGFALGATLIILVAVGGVLAWRRYRAKASARALERELMQQAELQAAGARPDRRAEIGELQTQLRRGIETLKATKLGGLGGERALYALPWYIIVGPPGAGKTTALLHSGLEFPIEAPGGKLRGVGGTRNCDWIFTNDGILLDTAGRYATQDDDRDEWLAFLDLLRRHRPRRPVNGLIVAVSLADLASATEEQAEAMAKTLRGRVDEIMTRLRMVVPVYVLFTKTDLVAGFVEFWEDLKKSERAQVWGATLPLRVPIDVDLGEMFGREFDGLVDALHGLALRRIGALPRVEARTRAMMFPLEMKALRAPLTEFSRALFRRNRYQDTPVFRGFYFTSGTQEGRPLDRVTAGMAQAFGLRLPMAADGPAVEPKSYFLTDFFRRVMFPDQNIAGRTSAEAQRQLLTRFAVFAAGTLLALLVVVPSALSFVRNLELTSKFKVAEAEAAKVTPADWSSPEGVSRNLALLEPLHNELRELERWRAEGRDSFHGWGFYAGDKLEVAGGRAFGGALRARFADPTAKALAQKLSLLRPLDNQTVNDEYREAYENLKAYLMLTEVEHLDVEWAASYLAPQWAVAQGRPELVPELKALGRDEQAGAGVEAKRLREQVRHYFDLVKRGVVEPAPRVEPVVRETRRKLGTELPLQLLYDTLIRDTNEKVAPIKYDKVFLAPGASYISPRNPKIMIAGAFTRDGWNHVRDRLQNVWRSRLIGESWVIGVEERYTAERTEAWLADLRARYFRDYDHAWSAFLRNIDVQSPKNGQRALAELVALSEPEWPYGRLLRIMNENMNLDTGAAGAELAPADRSVVEKFVAWLTKRRPKEGAKPTEAEGTFWPDELARFRPLAAFAVPPPDAKPAEAASTGLNQYMGTLHKLVSVLKDLNEADAKPNPKGAADEFEAAYRATWAMLASQDADTKRVLEPLLVPPIKMSWASVVGDAGAAAEGLWELDVWKPWTEKLQAVYPFKPDADDDANVDDFAEFFRPQTGTLWGFYEQNLKGSFGSRGGGSFEPSRRFGAEAPFGTNLASCLRNSQQITRAMFSDDAKAATVAFDVNLHSVSPDVSEVTISIDGLAHTYRNTPEEWLTAQWPAKNAKERGAKIVVRGYAGLKESIDRSGDFGLFRLLEAAEIRPIAGGARRGRPPAFVASWKLSTLPGATVSMAFRPAKAEHPFSHTFFSDLRCPRHITTR